MPKFLNFPDKFYTTKTIEDILDFPPHTSFDYTDNAAEAIPMLDLILPPDIIEMVNELVKQKDHAPTSLATPFGPTVSLRKSKSVDMGPNVLNFVNQYVWNLAKDLIGKTWQVDHNKLHHIYSQALLYDKGCFFVSHHDNGKAYDDGSKVYDNVNRRFTALLYFVPEHVEGGELQFDYVFDQYNNKVKITPKTGRLIVFPSNEIFSHEVTKVTDGLRIAIGTWFDLTF